MRNVSIVLATVLALLTPGVAGAQPGHVSDVTMLTGPSPLTDADFEPGGCGWDPYWSEIGPTSGVHSLRLEKDYESTLAVDPTDSRKMTAVWLQDDGQLVGSATSFDGGATWESEIIPDVTTCSGGMTHQTSYDTRVAIGPSSEGPGRAYVISTSQHRHGADPRAFVAPHIGVSTKTLDGLPWTKPVVIDRTGVIDYPVIAADPVRPDTAYVMWSHRVDVTFFSATHDGGKTWSSPAAVRVTTPGYLGLNELIVLRDGRIANMYIEVTPADLITASTGLPSTVPNDIYLSLSDDQGVTWSDPERVAQTYGFGSAFSVVEGEGTLFATWTTTSPDGWTTIVARRHAERWEELASFDSGASPAVDIAVGPDGVLGLTRYEARGDLSKSQGKTETYAVLSHSHDGGATWESSDLGGPFDLSSTDDFVGDHGSLEATACGFASTFTLGRGLAVHGVSDIFAAMVHLPTAPQGTCNSARPPR